MDASQHNRRAPRFDGPLHPRIGLVLSFVMILACGGCGTTRWSDSARTATEQLLITDAIDEAVQRLNFNVLADREVYFDPQYLSGAVDKNYLISSLRQHLLASGCILKESRDEAAFVVEARSGAVGTDRHDVMIGVPSVNMPTFLPTPVAFPASIPEIPLAKNTKQRGVVKLAVFAYNRKSGRRVWQSGIEPVTSFAKDSWLLGAGPFRKGTINDETSFVGDVIPLVGEKNSRDEDAKKVARVPLNHEQLFRDGPTTPVPESHPRLASYTSDVPPVSQSPPPALPTATAPELSAASSGPPGMLPENGAMAPIASPPYPVLPPPDAVAAIHTAPQGTPPTLPRSPTSVSSPATNRSADPRFAPRAVVSATVPEGTSMIAPEPEGKHDREVTDTSSPLRRLWPSYWFKRNESRGGQAAD